MESSLSVKVSQPDDEIHVVNSYTPAKLAEIEQRGPDDPSYHDKLVLAIMAHLIREQRDRGLCMTSSEFSLALIDLNS